MFHGAVERRIEPAVQFLHLQVETLRAQIAWLERRGHRLISADELAAALRGEHRLDPGWVHLTFDDGYVNNVTVVAELLGRRPWTCFVSTDHIDDGTRMPTYVLHRTLHHVSGPTLDLPSVGLSIPLPDAAARRRAMEQLSRRLKYMCAEDHDRLVADLEAALPESQRAELDARYESDAVMTWDQVRQLEAGGVTIGAHAARHRLLHPGQRPDEVRAQVEQCTRRIEAELGRKPTVFAYPNGMFADISPAAIDAVRDAGYDWAVTAVSGPCDPQSDPPLLLPRIGGGSLNALKRGLALAPLRWRGTRRAVATWRASLGG